MTSATLCKFLKTFYEYKNESKLTFPLTDIVPDLIKKGVDVKKSIIIPLLLQEGCEKPKNRLCCFGQSETIHKIWADAWYFSYKLLPSIFMGKFRMIYETVHISNDHIISELKTVCPNFKKSPYKESKNSYFKNPQPTISYILNMKRDELSIALRLWTSTEGSIMIFKDPRVGLVYPKLKIGCTHPTLVRELQELGHKLNIHFTIIKNKKTWSGYDGLYSNSLKATKEFLKIGGFLNIKISHKSKYFLNLYKQDVFLSILEFIVRQRGHTEKRNLKIPEIANEIRQIVEKREFKSPQFYINFLGSLI